MAEMVNMGDGKNVHSFYILTRERTATKFDKSYSSSNFKFSFLLQGEILIRNVTSAADERNGMIRLHPYDKPSYYCDCPLGEVQHIDEEEAKLLFPIRKMGDRFNVFSNKSRIKNGKKMTVGSYVYVKVRSVGSSNKHELRGIVRYKGPLPNEYGTWFGVELLEGIGRGTTNGMYKATRFFRCQNDSGVFVSLEKLRLCEDQTETKSESKTDTKEVNGIDDNNTDVFTKVKKFAQSWSNAMLEEQPCEDSVDMQKKSAEHASYAGHQMNDRVWVYIDEKLCAGYIRYIGRVPAGKEILVGIELDHAYGQGNGEYCRKQLFTCEMNHALFASIDNVISNDKLQEIYQQPEGVNVPALKNNPPSQPQKSEDIFNMESRFSNESQDQFKKKQENMLKKFQENKQKMAGTKDFQENMLKKSAEHASYAGHQVNDRVWVYIDDNLRGGYIRYIGRIPAGKEILVGIELDHAHGQANGEYCRKQLFTCEMNHALFTSIDNVISNYKLQEIYQQPEGVNVPALKNNPPSQPQTSEDILNMESRFSNQFQDQFKKKQENMLKKFQENKQKMAGTKDFQENMLKQSAEHALYAGHQVNDRVWVYIGDKLCRGYIRYIGGIPARKEKLVGIELLVNDEDFQKYLQPSLATAESREANSFHCQTPNCQGWCIYDDEVNDFDCPVCQKRNCLTCKAIHFPVNCKEYQDDLKRNAANDEAAKKTQDYLEQMLRTKDGMNCPTCGIILVQKDGCDWMKCSMCKTEICWAVRGPRWGPGGPGDTSGGCKCRVNNVRCDPQCKNCH